MRVVSQVFAFFTIRLLRFGKHTLHVNALKALCVLFHKVYPYFKEYKRH